jgi:membrane-associated phospholipid phosphatase
MMADQAFLGRPDLTLRQRAFAAVLAPRDAALPSRRIQIALWCAVLTAGLGACLWCYADGIAIYVPQAAPSVALIAVIAAAGEMARRSVNLRALASPLDAIAQIGFCTLFFPALQLPAARIGFPLIDGFLASVDRWMGFDWTAQFLFVAAHPALLSVLEIAYLSFGLQSTCMAFFVGIVSPRRLQLCLTANLICLIVCFATFALLPAAGAVGYLGIDSSPWPYVAQFNAARAGQIATLVPSEMRGIIQFPSYHAAMAVLFSYSFLALPRRFGWPLAACNGLMIFSALTVGAHHLVDIICGVALAILAIAIAHHVQRRLR